MFLDPDALKPVLSFIEVIALDESQDATGLKNAFIDVFKCNNLNSIINKIVFLSSDGVKCQLWKRIWIDCFASGSTPMSCFHLVLFSKIRACSNACTKTNIYYLYEKSEKKLCELKKLYQLLKDKIEINGASNKRALCTS